MLLYLLGIILPPFAILMYGKIIYAALNALIWLYALTTPGIIGIVFVIIGGWILWGLTVLHAVVVVHGARSDARTQQIVDAIKSNKDE